MKKTKAVKKVIVCAIDFIMKFMLTAAVVAIGGSLIATIEAMAINIMSINIIVAALIWIIIYAIYAYFVNILDII